MAGAVLGRDDCACVGTIGDGPEADNEALTCAEGRIDVGRAPLRRLTRSEYDATVRDLLGIDSSPAAAFPPDEAVAGYPSNSVALVSLGIVRDYFDAAEQLAESAVGTTLSPCAGGDAGCAQAFIASFGRRAYR